MYTIATAGHIDHGKSSLVRALTGIDPDRLPEEKARQMTIELGFAHFRLSSGEEVGIIDVPGHERFIKTMISGVGALDLVMFVIAADDGWMPQSEEHLAILKYLGVERGFIVLTKVDLVAADWSEMVKVDLAQRTISSFLKGCPIIEFSATDNRNRDLIRATIEQMLHQTRRREPTRSARLAVDRVFSVAGTGTVVTGTLREGTLAVGQEILIHPGQRRTRVKSLESFNAQLDIADPGIRLAVGLQSLERVEIERGDTLYYPADMTPGSIVGAVLNIEANAARHVKHGRQLTLLHGTAETEVSLQLPAEPTYDGSGGLIAVLKAEQPLLFEAGDRFIVRLVTPSLLVGGGRIIDPILTNYRRRNENLWRSLQRAAGLGVRALLEYSLSRQLIVDRRRLLVQSVFSESEVAAAVEQMLREHQVIQQGDEVILAREWETAQGLILTAMEEFHRANPHQAAVALAELSSKVALPGKLLSLALDELIVRGKLLRRESGVKLAAYSAELSSTLQALRQRVESLLDASEIAVLTRDELFALDKEARKVYTFLRQNELIIDAGGTVFLRANFEKLAGAIVSHLETHGKISVAEARDLTRSSRKVVLPVLEELDRRKITKRVEDYRYLCE